MQGGALAIPSVGLFWGRWARRVDHGLGALPVRAGQAMPPKNHPRQFILRTVQERRRYLEHTRQAHSRLKRWRVDSGLIPADPGTRRTFVQPDCDPEPILRQSAALPRLAQAPAEQRGRIFRSHPASFVEPGLSRLYVYRSMTMLRTWSPGPCKRTAKRNPLRSTTPGNRMLVKGPCGVPSAIREVENNRTGLARIQLGVTRIHGLTGTDIPQPRSRSAFVRSHG